MTTTKEPPVWAEEDDGGDDANWREELFALRQLVGAMASRLAARAENPFDELQTIRRLASEHAGLGERMSPKRDPDIIRREIDGVIEQAESRVM